MRFSSLIRFVTQPEEVKARVRDNPELPEAKSPYLISNRTRSAQGGHTKGAFDCNVAHFTNGDESFLYHLIPIDEQTRWPDIPIDLLPIQHTLANDLVTLSQQEAPVKGLITGGIDFDSPFKGCGSLGSKRLFNGIQKVLEPLREIVPSTIWGRRNLGLNRSLNLVYTVANDTYHLWAGYHLQTLQDMQKTFRHIRIASGDTLELPNQDIVHGPADLSPNLSA